MKKKNFFYSVLISALFILSGKLFAQAEPAADAAVITIQPSFSYAAVNGDWAKFEEDSWTSRHASGGIESLIVSKQINEKDSFDFEGRAIAGNNDFNANLTLAREGLGSLTVAFKEFRKYYDPTGGYYSPFGPSNNNPVNPSGNLQLDIGNFKVEGILAKEDSPQYSLSYERAFRSGSKSLLEWGEVTGAVDRQLYPAALETHETVDRVKAGVKYETKSSEVSAEQIWEGTQAKNEDNYREILTLATGLVTAQNRRLENIDSDLYSTILRGSKDFNDKLSVSCGVLYNYYRGGSLENIAGTGSGARNMDNPASIAQNDVTVFPVIYFKPFKKLSMSFGSKAEFINKNGDADFNYSGGGERIGILENIEQEIFTQNLQLKYNGMKNVAWYANAVFEKKLITELERQTSTTTASNRFSRQTDTIANTYNFTLGAKWYPVSKVTISVEDIFKDKFIDNNNESISGDVVAGYRGFISRLDLSSNIPTVKLNYKPLRWMAYAFGYSYENSVIGVVTSVSRALEKSKNKVHAYSVEAVLTPADYFYLSLFYERKNDFTSTRANGAEGTTVQQPDYKANVDVLGFNSIYALSKSTSLNLGYSMYKTDNFNDFSATGMPYGLDNFSQDISFSVKQALNKNSFLEFKYKYLDYQESSNNHANDYDAQIFSAAMKAVF